MKHRCYDVSAENYHRYGGRGIKVCDRWLESFENFLEDMGLRPDGSYSLDRKENDGHYEPNNCRWTTALVQGNNKSNNVRYLYKGQMKTVPEIAREEGIPAITLGSRLLRYGYTLDEALGKKAKHHVYTHDGVTKSLRDWADSAGMSYGRLYVRLFGLKWPFDKAIVS